MKYIAGEKRIKMARSQKLYSTNQEFLNPVWLMYPKNMASIIGNERNTFILKNIAHGGFADKYVTHE